MRTGADVLAAPTWALLDAPVICAEALATLTAIPDCSVDAIVTDPPAAISFMGRAWDSDRGGREAWIAWLAEIMGEALRVCKPGAHALVWALPRTSHWTAMALEDAGWEVRDRIAHTFGSGFPKGLDVSRAIDKAAGAERQVVGPRRWDGRDPNGTALGQMNDDGWEAKPDAENGATAPATPEAAQWQGWNVALKPATEDWWLCRKPLEGNVAQNVLKYGTGAINIDATRIEGPKAGGSGTPPLQFGGANHRPFHDNAEPTGADFDTSQGRYPPNFVLSHAEGCEPIGTRIVKGDQRDTGEGERPGGFADVGAESGDAEPNAPVYGDEEVVEWSCVENCPIRELDEQSGDRKAGGNLNGSEPSRTGGEGTVAYGEFKDRRRWESYADSGGASRFFPTFPPDHGDPVLWKYVAKPSTAERNAGLEGFEERTADPYGEHRGRRMEDKSRIDGKPAKRAQNHHPTLKGIALMRWLVRLVTPPDGGLVLDMFAGSGSTGCAAALEGFDFAGIEMEPAFAAIASARIAWWQQHRGREGEEVLRMARKIERKAAEDEAAGQLGLELS